MHITYTVSLYFDSPLHSTNFK